jgi:uncharacterized protein (TIGR02596 family)
MNLPSGQPPRLPSKAPSRKKAFSLIELLAVIAIISLLAALVVPAVTGISRSYQMTSASHAVMNQLVQARQVALTRGYPVQVRFYKLPGYTESSAAAPSQYRALQLFIESDPIMTGGSASVPVKALSKPVFFSAPVEILPNQSSLLTLPVTTSPQETVSGFGNNYSYVSFRFKPSGQTDLPATASGIMLALASGTNGSGLPANFRAVEIDSVTGAVRDYAP